MQQPTCCNLRIRSTADAHKIFMAVRQGILRMVTRRLDADERSALRSGCIYAWEERGPHTETTGLGIERFTEGRRWSPSRVRDEFLFYYEKYSPPPDLNNPGGKLVEVKPPRDWDPLVKQTYSVWVETDKGRRKWHLTAYFTQATIDQLSTVEDIPRIRELVVPEGMFKSTRLAKNRSRLDENKSSDAARTINSRSYAAYPTPYHYQTKAPRGTPGIPVLMHEPYHTRQSSPVYETLHSPISPQDSGYYHQNQLAYPNENRSHSSPSNPYHRPLPYSIPSYGHSNTNDTPSARHEEDNSYYTSSPSPWSNENGLDYSLPPPQRQAEPGISAPPQTRSTHNQADDTFSYACQPSALMHNNSTSLYSTQYSMNSLNSGYSPLPPPPALTLPNPAERGGHLSPLSIPERSNGVRYSQDSSPISPEELPTLQHATESYVRAGAAPELAPLEVIRRPFHRRAVHDELTLRMLQASQANP